MRANFGPAGNSDSFQKMGYKSFADIPRYVREMGLDCYEYQCGRGVKISEESAKKLGKLAEEEGTALSVHSPYYISLSGIEEEKRLKSIDYVLQTARAAQAMGARRIVVHSGSCGKLSREEALALAKDTLARCQQALDENGLEQIILCPETMGKVGQLGTLEEVMELCKVSERFLPCVDFGHLNARTFGGIRGKTEFAAILDTMERELGAERARVFHSHFSKIEYTQKGGEKMHLTFADTLFGPDYEPLMELLAQRGYTPTIICESAGTQAEDARTMKQYYEQCLEQRG